MLLGKEDVGEDDTFDDAEAFVPDNAGNLPTPLCDQAAVQEQADGWALLWKEGESYEEPKLNMSADMFLQLLPDSIYEAALTFLAETGLP